MRWHDGMDGGGGWLVMGLLMLVFLGLVIWAVVWMTLGGRPARSAPGGPHWSGPPTPRQILDERFARGEIDEDEYRKRRDVLGSR